MLEMGDLHPIEYSRVALPCTLPPVWLELRYRIHFLIGKLSYSPSSDPSLAVLLLDVMYTMYAHHRSKSYSSPCALGSSISFIPPCSTPSPFCLC